MAEVTDFTKRLAAGAKVAAKDDTLLNAITDLCRSHADNLRKQPLSDVYDLLALDIMSVAAIEDFNTARAQIAALLRLTYSQGPAEALRSQMP